MNKIYYPSLLHYKYMQFLHITYWLKVYFVLLNILLITITLSIVRHIFIVQQFKTPWEWLPNTSNSSHAIYTLQRKTQFHKAQLHKVRVFISHPLSSKDIPDLKVRIILQDLQDVKPLPPICFWDLKATIKHRSKITIRKSTMIILKNYPFHSSN